MYLDFRGASLVELWYWWICTFHTEVLRKKLISFRIGILIKLKSLRLESRTLQECLKFAVGCVWVQFLNYLLSLIMPSPDFTAYELSRIWASCCCDFGELWYFPLNSVFGFFHSHISSKGIRLLTWGMSFKPTWPAAAFRWKEGKKIKQTC